jgi:hypothetical protein
MGAVVPFPTTAPIAPPPAFGATTGDPPNVDAARTEILDRLLHAWQTR